MMRSIKAVSCLCILFLCLAYTHPLMADTSPAAPETNGKAVILIDASSGRVLFERNSHQQLPPASVTKIMTGLLVVEHGDLDKKVTVSEFAAETPESTVYLEPGETLTRRELLYAAMLPSANDACNALAESIAGDEAGFITLMNQRAQELGLKDTHFKNAHGLHSEGHYTSASDLAMMTRQALSYPVFAEVVKTKYEVIPWDSRPDEDRILINQNRLLYRYDDAVGVKTGYTKQAGNCVVGAARRGDMVLIAVSMNSTTVYDDLIHMLDYGFDNYHLVTLSRSNQTLGQVKVVKGEADINKVRPVSDVAIAVTDEESGYLAYSLSLPSSVTAPVKQGDILGVCKIFLKEKQVGSIDMAAAQNIAVSHSWLEIIHGKTSLLTASKWFKTLMVALVMLLLYINRRKLEAILKRLLLFLLRNHLPNRRRRRRY